MHMDARVPSTWLLPPPQNKYPCIPLCVVGWTIDTDNKMWKVVQYIQIQPLMTLIVSGRMCVHAVSHALMVNRPNVHRHLAQ